MVKSVPRGTLLFPDAETRKKAVEHILRARLTSQRVQDRASKPTFFRDYEQVMMRARHAEVVGQPDHQIALSAVEGIVPLTWQKSGGTRCERRQ